MGADNPTVIAAGRPESADAGDGKTARKPGSFKSR